MAARKTGSYGMKHELFFYTPGVTQEQLGCLGSRAFADLSDAVTAALDGLPTGARIALVPDGPYTFARARFRLESLDSQRKIIPLLQPSQSSVEVIRASYCQLPDRASQRTTRFGCATSL